MHTHAHTDKYRDANTQTQTQVGIMASPLSTNIRGMISSPMENLLLPPRTYVN